ncbi:hypothetical protein RDI58_017754 [Solanum bulbocastanum]|uniref:Uncharacterized protein n=1 Tax=Solanum bulbocastanum TaxID=147425 RepID=A0AAN8Y952_SOLBU
MPLGHTSFLEKEVAYVSFDKDVRYLSNKGAGSQMGYQETNHALWRPEEMVSGETKKGSCVIKIEQEEMIHKIIRVQIHMCLPINRVLPRIKKA